MDAPLSCVTGSGELQSGVGALQLHSRGPGEPAKQLSRFAATPARQDHLAKQLSRFAATPARRDQLAKQFALQPHRRGQDQLAKQLSRFAAPPARPPHSPP